MVRFIAGLMVLLGLIACTQEVSQHQPVDTFRDPSAQIASQTDVTAARMAGEWHVRQRFSGYSAMGPNLELSVLPAGALQLRLPISACVQSVCTNDGHALVLLEPTGPGRWTPVNPPQALFDQELWVMWMDYDTRTAAIGTPSGEFGWIMDKSASGGRDRLVAARDIMEWFGYDVTKLQAVDS